ncbi:MAG: signal recognition particle-docking protein FtsY [Christensenellales bacterium]|jgi:fused signal recognition particle receptor
MGLFDFFKRKKNQPAPDAQPSASSAARADEPSAAGAPTADTTQPVSSADEPAPEAPRSAASAAQPAPVERHEPSAQQAEPTPPTREGVFKRLVKGLTRTREGIASKLEQLVGLYPTLDEEFYEDLEAVLLSADVGVPTTMEILDQLRERVKTDRVKDTALVKGMLRDIVSQMMREPDEPEDDRPGILLIVGVNGVGKTTSIGKLAKRFTENGQSVMLAAADTFRAAAIDQLGVWAERAGVPMIRHEEGADPASVVFDAIASAKSKKIDVLICDTAGRLHNKKNLMEEMKKIGRVVDREYPEARKEVLLVLDATTGQNAVMQCKAFLEAVEVTGIILTKLDGTAKGGVVLAIRRELGIPVRFVGMGEGIDDMQPFDPEGFAQALFEEV